MSSRTFKPSGPLRGDFEPPADKSISHRAALFGAMADEPITITNYLDSADTRSTLDALLTLGAAVEEEGDHLVIRGVGLHSPLEATGRAARRRQLGHAAAAPARAGSPGSRAEPGRSTATSRSAAGPVDRVVEPLSRMGARMEAREGRLPAADRARRRAGRHRVLDPGCERTGEVVRPDRGNAGVRLDDADGEPAEPRSHRAHARAVARPVRARRAADNGGAGRRARARRDRGARRPVVGRLHRRRRRARPGLARGRSQRRAQLDPLRLLPHRAAHGGGDRRRPRGAGHVQRPRSRSASSTSASERSRAPTSSRTRFRLRSTS